MSRYVLFTDLDGCLLDCDRSSFDHVRPALDSLRSAGIPVILVSGKTRAEIEPLRERLDHHDPFIVENGAAAYVPFETFDFTPERSRRRFSYHIIELARPMPSYGMCYGNRSGGNPAARFKISPPMRSWRRQGFRVKMRCKYASGVR